jgi:hypothetical protein
VVGFLFIVYYKSIDQYKQGIRKFRLKNIKNWLKNASFESSFLCKAMRSTPECVNLQLNHIELTVLRNLISHDHLFLHLLSHNPTKYSSIHIAYPLPKISLYLFILTQNFTNFLVECVIILLILF